MKSFFGQILKAALPLARFYVKSQYPSEHAAAEKAIPRLKELARDRTETKIDDKVVDLIGYLLHG